MPRLVETKGGVEPLVVPTNPDGTIGYYAVAFVRADSPYKTLDDLKGKIWAWAEPNSSSGYLFPLVGFRKMGLEPGEALRQGGVLGRPRAEHHRRARQGLRRRGHLDQRRREAHPRRPAHDAQRKVLKKEDIRIIWVSELIPNPVIAIRSDVPAQMKADLKAMFLNLHKDDPAVFREVVRGESQGYQEVKHEVYQIAVDLRNQLAKERRGR